MTEKKWLTAADPEPMLKFLRKKASDRKLRLLICGCSQLLADFMTAAPLRQAIEVSEKFADGKASEAERAAAERELRGWDEWEAHEEAYGCALGSVMPSATETAAPALHEVANGFASQVEGRMGTKNWAKKHDAAQTQLVSFVREVFGNPFRPAAVDPRWLTETVVSLAAGIYAERAFDRMPILADALEDAGCDSADILTHCRGDGPHVCGCWVVDLVLGKS